MRPLISSLVFDYISTYYEHEGFCYIQDGDLSYLFLEPVSKIWADAGGSYYKTSDHLESYQDPWKALERLPPVSRENPAPEALPAHAGYFSYEFAGIIESSAEGFGGQSLVPFYTFYTYRHLLVVSHDTARLLENKYAGGLQPFWTMGPQSQKFRNGNVTPSYSLEELEGELTPFSNFSRETYRVAVANIKKLLAKGEAYQANLSQQFSIETSKVRLPDFFCAFLDQMQGRYSAFFHSLNESDSKPFSIVSGSPELFLSHKEGRLLTSPIKGTRRKINNVLQEQKELVASEKDDSELTMIVDIERNDLSRVAEPGSVEVKALKRVDSISHLHHLVSDVACRVRPDINLKEIISATFPSGSITGAPKIAAMRIISKYENRPRGVYTGSIGWMADSGQFRFNVAIRTVLICNETLYYSAGGGITVSSDPDDEYQESLSKAIGFYLAYISSKKVSG